MDAHKTMENILEAIGLNTVQIGLFREQKISPDIVSHLSLYDLKCLGLTDKGDIMKLRMECITYGKRKTREGQRGFDIPKLTIKSLLESGFSIVDVSQVLCISESTLYRKMRQYNISKQVFASIADNQLDDVVSEMITEFPRSGEVILRKLLQEKGLKVQRLRLRNSLRRLDNQGLRERKRKRLRRRVYSVTGPNHLWHIDTNHKLIRWHIVICGGIDGFSRLVTFLSCTDNNKASTVFDSFSSGIQEYGTPMRVRSDMGMENVKVAEHMNNVRGPNSMLMGKSTHNQRIERLWRDVFDGALSYYYDLFYFLEDEDLLDMLNEKHLYALHRVYLGSINERLRIWRCAWNNHRIRTVKSTPLRLYTAGMLNNPPTEPLSDTDLSDPLDAETEESDAEDADDRAPAFRFPSLNLSAHCLSQLDRECPQNWTSDNHGIDVYQRAKLILETF